MFRLVVILLLLASPVRADVAFGPWHALVTRNGTVEVRPFGLNDQRLVWREKGMQFPKISGYRDVAVQFLARRPEEDFDWLMVETDQGGNSCMAFSLHLIKFGPGWAGVSDDIGACRPKPREIRVLPGRIELDYDAPDDVTVALRTVAFDGQRLTETETPAAPVAPGAAIDPRRWLGRYPVEPLEDPQQAARFVALMGAAEVNALIAHVGGPAEQVIEQGGWVLGFGCMAHNCGDARGGWGIRIADGALAVAMFDGPAARGWGLTGDPVVAGFLAARRR